MSAVTAEIREPVASARPAPRQWVEHQAFPAFEQAEALRFQWDELAERSGGDIFTTFDWCCTWWRHFGRGRTLRIHTYRDVQRRLVSVLPTFCEELRWGPSRLRVIRLVGADHGVTPAGFLIQPGFERAVADDFAKRLADEPRWDLVHFGELAGYNAGYGAFAAELRRASPKVGVVHSPADYPQMVFDLPKTFEQYLAGLSGSERSNIRKRERRLAQKHRVEVSVVPARDLPRHFGAFAAQHERQWRHEGRLGHFLDWPGAMAFHRDLLRALGDQGRVMLVRFAADEEIVGYQYNLAFNGRMHWVIGSRSLDPKWDEYSPGRLLHCGTVRAAIGAGAEQLDALGGYYEFKRRLGAKVLGLQSIRIVNPSRRSRLRLRLFALMTRLIDTVYHRAWYWHLAPWIRKNPRFGSRINLQQGLRTRFLRARFLVAARRPRSHQASVGAANDV